MKRYFCDCGQQVFFDSTSCISCGATLGYEPARQEIVTLTPVNTTENQWRINHDDTTSIFRRCHNAVEYDVCNWLVTDEERDFCPACQCNRTIPNLDKPINLNRWRLIEVAKKRLIYSLHQLGLPVVSRWDDEEHGLWFDFLEDQRSDYDIAEGFISTGHSGGVITINVLEADDVQRESMRTEMNEQYRTLLGHFRHESGHYYWQIFFNENLDMLEEFERVFGKSSINYQAALDHYYENPPSANYWLGNYISAYASSHPLEDWAETWAHYLHMLDTIDSAMGYGLTDSVDIRGDFDDMINSWVELSLALNELNRSMGLADAYPFVIAGKVRQKLNFIHCLLNKQTF